MMQYFWIYITWGNMFNLRIPFRIVSYFPSSAAAPERHRNAPFQSAVLLHRLLVLSELLAPFTGEQNMGTPWFNRHARRFDPTASRVPASWPVTPRSVSTHTTSTVSGSRSRSLAPIVPRLRAAASWLSRNSSPAVCVRSLEAPRGGQFTLNGH